MRTNALLAAALRQADAQRVRLEALIDHLPDTAVMIFDRFFVLEMVAGPGARKWKYAERNIVPGLRLEDIAPPDVVDILRPHYQSALDGPAASLEYHSIPTGLDFKIDAVPMADADGKVRHILVMIADVTARRASEAALRFAEERYRMAFEAAPVGMAHFSLNGHFEVVNQALCDLVGYTAEELCSMRYESIVHPDAHTRIIDTLQRMVDGAHGSTWASEGRLIHADGTVVWVAQSTTIVRDSDGQASHFLAHYQDVTDRKQFDSQLKYLAEHDPLTGLQNRRSFEFALERQATSIVRVGRTAALFALDLDNFKQINDTLGHGAGDEVIVSLADVLRRRLRSTDVIARLGGDEFAVILPNTTPERALKVAAGLLEAIRNEVKVLSARVPRLTTSIGIAFFDKPGLIGADVLRNADLTMFDAKEAGGDRYAVYRQLTAPYISEPGVVSTTPVSSHVFSPERIIGQPP